MTGKEVTGISVVIAVYNEQDNISPLIDELLKVKENLPQAMEIILVDDGSTDRSFDQIVKQKAKSGDIKGISFKRNFGQTAAMLAGIDNSKHDIIVTMDADLQNDPRDIGRLIAELEKGSDIVSGWRKNRRDSFVTRIIPSLAANRLISWYTGVNLHDYGCTLKAYRKEFFGKIRLFGELHRFIPALMSWSGAAIQEIEVNHRPRRHGRSKYGLGRTLSVVLDLLTVKFLLDSSKGPMRIFGRLGLLCFLFSLISGAATLIMKITSGVDMTGNPFLYLTIFLMIAAYQFFSIGLLGELLVRIYQERKGAHPYVIKEII